MPLGGESARVSAAVVLVDIPAVPPRRPSPAGSAYRPSTTAPTAAVRPRPLAVAAADSRATPAGSCPSTVAAAAIAPATTTPTGAATLTAATHPAAPALSGAAPAASAAAAPATATPSRTRRYRRAGAGAPSRGGPTDSPAAVGAAETAPRAESACCHLPSVLRRWPDDRLLRPIHLVALKRGCPVHGGNSPPFPEGRGGRTAPLGS